MISDKAKSLIARFFLEIAERDDEIENIKQVLAQKKEFEPYSTFCKLDVLQKGYITYQDIGLFLQNNWVSTDPLIVEKFINLDFWKSLGKISYPTYLSLIVPHYNDTLKFDVLQRKPTLQSPVDPLPSVVVAHLLRLFEKQSELEGILAEIRTRLREMRIVPFKAFEAIDFANTHFVDSKNLGRFIREMGGVVTKKGVYAAIKRFDKDGDQKLSFVEFLPAILPFEPFEEGDISNVYTEIPSPSKILLQRSMIDSGAKQRISEFTLEPAPETFRTPEKAKPEREVGESVHPTTAETNILGSMRKPPSSSGHSISVELTESRLPVRSLFTEGVDLKKIFERQISLDKSIEDKKRGLWEKDDFSTAGVFAFFNATEQNGVTAKEMADALTPLGIETSDILLLYREYDKNNDGVLTVDDIEDMFKPQGAPPLQKKKTDLSEETEELLRDVLVDLINLEAELEKMRVEIASKDFDFVSAFEECAQFKSGISLIEVENFLQCSAEDAEILLRRYDKNKDGLITYLEFTQELVPKYPGK